MENGKLKTKLCTEDVINISPEEKDFAEIIISGKYEEPYNPLHTDKPQDIKE